MAEDPHPPEHAIASFVVFVVLFGAE
eukprot:jgi/Pico_ML_1/55196/g924.t1